MRAITIPAIPLALALTLTVVLTAAISSRTRENRACLLIAEMQRESGRDGTCEDKTKSDSVDYAFWNIDGGRRWCHDTTGIDLDRDGGPLHCMIIHPTTDEAARNKENAKIKAEKADAETKAKIEADVKTKIEAEVKAKSEAENKVKDAALAAEAKAQATSANAENAGSAGSAGGSAKGERK